MKQLERKLRSNAGASMIFALVFLLFCVFIGGSVLAAATANAGRVASMTTDQQEYLSQRSAALVMADMLTETDDAPMQLIVKEVVMTTSSGVPAEGEEDGAATSTTIETTYTMETNEAKRRSVLQRILIENAVRKYRASKADAGTGTEHFSGFLFAGMTDTYTKDTLQLYQSDVVSFGVIDPASTELTVWGNMSGYDMELGFDELDENGLLKSDPLSQISLTINAYFSTSDAVTVEKNGTTSKTTTTIIRWDPPVIEKGGVSDE